MLEDKALQLMLEEAIQLLSTTSQVIKAESITNIDRLHVAVAGESGTGKSYLIAKTARKPLLHYDFDNRRDSIAGTKGVIIKTMFDLKDDEPRAFGQLESDITSLEYLKSNKKLPFISVALDSMTFLRKYAEHQFLKDCSNASRAKFKIGSTQYYIPKDWDAVTGVQKMLEGIIDRLYELGVDVYVTFHTRPEKDQQKSTKENPVYTDRLTVDPPNLKMLLPKFNDKWRTYFSDGYKVQLKPDYQWNGSTVLRNVQTEEPADIQKLLEKHAGK